MDKTLKITITFATGLGLNIMTDFFEELLNNIKKRYKIKNKQKMILEREFFIWAWIVGEYYGLFFIKSKNYQTVEFTKIMLKYFEIVVNPKEERERYNFYKEYIRKVLSERKEDYEGQEYNQRVKEKLITIFSLIILRYLKPEIKEIKEVDEEKINKFNKNYNLDFNLICDQLETIFYFIIDIADHYINKASETEIDKIFNTLLNEKIVQKLMVNIKLIK